MPLKVYSKVGKYPPIEFFVKSKKEIPSDDPYVKYIVTEFPSVLLIEKEDHLILGFPIRDDLFVFKLHFHWDLTHVSSAFFAISIDITKKDIALETLEKLGFSYEFCDNLNPS